MTTPSLTSVASSVLGPMAESPRAIFLAHCAKGELAYQVANDGRAVFYPRVVQPGTGDTNLEWRISAGLGRVYASTTVRPRGEDPYNVCVVAMDEGFRLMSAVTDIDPDAVTIGARVRVEMKPLGPENTPLPTFVTVKEDND